VIIIKIEPTEVFMYIFRRILISSILLLGLATYANLSGAENSLIVQRDSGGQSNYMNNGNHFNADNGNTFSRSFYRNEEGNNYNDYPPAYGYGYFGSTPLAPNSQIFPGETQANDLYWGEVQQMEQQ
jgi:hypothetical protein